MFTLATFVLAAAFGVSALFWIVLAASVIGLLLDPWPAKVWKVLAALVLVILAVLLVVGVGG